MRNYAKNITAKYGGFHWYPAKTSVDPESIFLLDAITKGPSKTPVLRSISPNVPDDTSRDLVLLRLAIAETPELLVRQRVDGLETVQLGNWRDGSRHTCDLTEFRLLASRNTGPPWEA